VPTARELLEQADALMRRNRQMAERAVGGPAVGPTTLPDEAPAARIEPGLRTAPPPAEPAPRAAPEPAAAPAPATRVEPVPPSPVVEEADIPVLEEVVAPEAPAGEADDFPVLTDAIDEIEVSSPPVDEGEPSDWLMPPAEEESVLGPAPPSVAVVPPVKPESVAAASAGGPPTADVESALSAPRRPEIEDLAAQAEATSDLDVTIRRDVPTLGAPAAPRSAPPEIEDLAEASLADLDPDVTWTRPVRPAAAAALAARPAALEPGAPAVQAAPASAGLPPGTDWDALAEEIRMQVLQRIDLFTDTGLRDRLGERLKPIVDRASADLVATINQHVGELLRAYVAEAIEREIDRWRASH
jgi:hypothetical protein